MKRKKCIILLPTSYNDGTAVPLGVLSGILKDIDREFDGHTVDGATEGAYRIDDGTMVADKCLKVWVIMEMGREDELRKMARRFARILKQESIYFEVTDVDVEFVRPSPDEGEEQ